MLIQTGKDRRTPLHFAAENGHEGVVKLLIEKGADVDAANKDGWTPLHVAGERGYLYIVKYFIEEKGVNSGNIFDATKNGYLGIVKYFVEKGSNVNAKSRLCGQNFKEAIQEPQQNLENP